MVIIDGISCFLTVCLAKSVLGSLLPVLHIVFCLTYWSLNSQSLEYQAVQDLKGRGNQENLWEKEGLADTVDRVVKGTECQRKGGASRYLTGKRLSQRK